MDATEALAGKQPSNAFDDIEYTALQLAAVQAYGPHAQVEVTYLTCESIQPMEISSRKLESRREKLQAFQAHYNQIRPHWALQPAAGGDVVTPDEVYRGKIAIVLPKWQSWAKAAKQKLDDAKAADAVATNKELGKAA